ncbi:MAG TPA: sulfate adenylyltransferase [Actinomycetota bacterium]|nr:sulfate adenylyltransferase [Actinomycetota bacterium]
MTANETIPPHGGTLVNLQFPEEQAEQAAAEAEHLPKVSIGDRELSDLELMAVGALSPLTGFMGEKDYWSVIRTMHLENGLPWTIPVGLSLTEEEAKRVGGASRVALQSRDRSVALVDLEAIYRRDKEAESQAVFRTTDPEHPGVKALLDAGDYLVAGAVRVIRLPQHGTFQQYRLTPSQTRAAFAQRGWRTVVGFQTRNPVHRAHEYLQKCALEIVDGLLLHPLVGETKGDDVPADVRMRCYEILFENYYPKDRAMITVFPAAMRYAGPKEAIWHAICRKNYGCTHFIVGRDHAGVGSYYGTYDAQKIFEEFEAEELGITPLFFEHSFFCRKCDEMASPKTCPHSDEDRVILSGTKVREMLRAGQKPPKEFSRPEVAQILIEAMQENVDPRALASPGDGG